MLSPFVHRLQAVLVDPERTGHNVLKMLDSWGDDAFDFVRHQVPRIVAVLIIAFILTRLLKTVARHLSSLSNSQGLPSAVRSQQLRTLSSVIHSVGLFVIMFVAALQILPLLGINMGPLLASAGIAGVAIGFGAQTLVRDFINGFFILAENQYDIGDTIKAAGVQGTVEAMTVRRTVLRDDNGTVHNIPNSEIKIVSNLSRDWTELDLNISVAYSADSDYVIKLLHEVGYELASDPTYSLMMLAKPEVPGIEKVSGDTVDYLMQVKTKPAKKDDIARELRRRIKACFEKNQIEPGNPNRVYVMDGVKPTG
ncbi:MAG: mechanosensitive ion channel family protein [Candidatus Korobacteraceae bacterium]